MSIGPLSTFAFRDSMRARLERTQARFDQATREVASGRHYDVGLKLGTATSRTVDARQLIGDIDAIKGANDLTAQRLSVAQASMSAAVDIANDFFSSVVSSMQSGANRQLMIEDARSKLGALTALMSAASNGAYVFGGLNSQQVPLTDYIEDDAQTARNAVVAAFTTEFGFPPDDPQAAAITPAQIDSYLGGSFAALFEAPDWQANFSSAIDGPVSMRIGRGDEVDATFNANDKGIRKLVSTLVAAVDGGTAALDAETFATFASRLAESASSAAAELTRNQASIGLLQERVAGAGERIAAERGTFEGVIGALENVDIGEASVRLNDLASLLDASYAVTARMQRLTILNYL